MKICIDVQSAITQRAGVGRYAALLVQHLGALVDDDDLVLFYFDFKRNGTPFETPNATHRAVRWCPGRAAQLAWKTVQWPPFDLFSGPADVYHFPNFILPPLSRGKSIVTIHDMSFLRFPQFAEERNQRYLAARIRDTAARADAIITDSQFSADEIQDLLNVEPERINPIHLGVAHDFQAPAADNVQRFLKTHQIDRPYILTVCTLEPRKNIPLAVEMFERLADFDGHLVIAGMRGWKYEPILERIRTSSRASDIRYLEYITDQELPALYAGAELFVFPSLYEGFGFPPLESMACGTPVLSSSGGSLAEVCGPGAVLMDTFDIDLWVEQAERTLSDTGYRAHLIKKGHEQAKKYSWAETARKTWAVYRELET